jgi:amidohydrolase
MTAIETARKRAHAAIEAADRDLREISLSIHSHPELNFEEHHAHRVLTDYLEAQRFEVTRGAFGMPTAFSAVVGSGSPRVAILCEYDALPEIGHACGHNLIAISGLAAALGAKAGLEPGHGTVVVLGSPAEEGGGGKILMIERGAFEGIDAAMMLHPSPSSSAWGNLIALQQLQADYYGRNAHAGSNPWTGVNALDAMVLAYASISAMRQQIRPTDRVHGVITKGGVKPNIIPDHTSAEFYIRSATVGQLDELRTKISGCFEGAATATGCRLELKSVGAPYSEVITNDVLAEAYCENMERFEVRLPTRAASNGLRGASTDMGNVSHVVPSIHPMFAIPTDAANHTPGFTAAAATREAHLATLKAATGLAMTALDVLTRPAVLEAAQSEFQAVRA